MNKKQAKTINFDCRNYQTTHTIIQQRHSNKSRKNRSGLKLRNETNFSLKMLYKGCFIACYSDYKVSLLSEPIKRYVNFKKIECLL